MRTSTRCTRRCSDPSTASAPRPSRPSTLRVDGTLELVHDHATDGRGLDLERSARVLDYLVKVWRRPIVLASVDGEGRTLQLTANPA